ncbi:hypothetical protein OG978_42365 (plasmid) [Streptomyces sp. NBC_01591]|uniref:hypothetical protein n=1 Tax=Streptomyces sp. NBC_01591 TaxID=2975888 RepID=UPI002DDC11B0|nr:hypothetical protein [Streptomyces sp. NBC_01591]WSD73836.1 hypothetical protein OG978_42365 [Streptomyces sp. NBC_01591]
MSEETAFEAVSRLYQEFMKLPFPPRLGGADRAGFDLVMLDSDTAGWVFTWVKNGGELEARGRSGLLRCIARLDRVIPVLSEADDPEYWHRLHEMARLVADSPHVATK